MEKLKKKEKEEIKNEDNLIENKKNEERNKNIRKFEKLRKIKKLADKQLVNTFLNLYKNSEQKEKNFYDKNLKLMSKNQMIQFMKFSLEDELKKDSFEDLLNNLYNDKLITNESLEN